MTFNQRLKEEMEYTGIRHKDLAEKAQISQRALLTYVSSKNPSMPPADVAVRIAKALNLSVEYLITGTNTFSYPTPKEKSLLTSFNQLSPKEQKAISDLIISLSKKSE